MCATRQQNTLWRHRHARSHSTHHRCRTATPVGQLALGALDFLPAPGFAGHTGRLGRTGCVGGVGGGARRPGPSSGACATACFTLGIWTTQQTRAPNTTQRVRRLLYWPQSVPMRYEARMHPPRWKVNSVKLPPNTRTERVAHRVAQGEQLREWDSSGVPRSETTQLPLPRTGLHHNRLPLDCAVKVAQQQRPWRALTLSSWASCVCT